MKGCGLSISLHPYCDEHMGKAIAALREWRGDAPADLARLTMRRFVLCYALIAFTPMIAAVVWLEMTAPLMRTKVFFGFMLLIVVVLVVFGTFQSVASRLAIWRDNDAAEELAKKSFVGGYSELTGVVAAGLLLSALDKFRLEFLVLVASFGVFWFVAVCIRRYAFDAWFVERIKERLVLEPKGPTP